VADAQRLVRFFDAVQRLRRDRLVLAYHDRSDGGLLATVAEMMFAGRLGASLTLTGSEHDVFAQLFSEEAGAVLQVADSRLSAVRDTLEECGLRRGARCRGVNDGARTRRPDTAGLEG